MVGEAGIGKSSLLESFVTRLRGQELVVVVGCDDLLAPRPLGPIRDLVAQLPDDLQAEVADDLSGASLAPVLLHGAERGGVIVIEDVHSADDATVDVIRQLTSPVRDLPFVIVISYRDEDVGLGHPMRKLLGTIRGPHVAHLRLGPLSVDSVALLAVDSSRDAAEVFDASGGNPLFVTELIATPPGDLPRSIKDTVVSRLGELSAEDVEVVRAISVVPVRIEQPGRAPLRGLRVQPCGGRNEGSSPVMPRTCGSGTSSSVTPWRTPWPCPRPCASIAVSPAISMTAARTRRGSSTTRVRSGNYIDLLLEAGPIAARQAVIAGAHRQAVEHLDAVLAQRVG